MARKRTLSTLDTSIAYEVVGLDLAKEDVAIAAFGPDHEGPYLIDRMPYDKLYALLADMAPTLVAMEPCSGAHQIAEQIQELGHEVMMISGRHVQAWVKDHCNGQKTDLNDAFALLNLAFDRWLTPIRGKTREECRLLALQASYRQLQGQRTKTLVHVKATLHAWGFPIRTGSFNQKVLHDAREHESGTVFLAKWNDRRSSWNGLWPMNSRKTERLSRQSGTFLSQTGTLP